MSALREFSVWSAALGEHRTISALIPDAPHPPVLIMADGQLLADLAPTIDRATSEGAVPPVAVIAPHSTARRRAEYNPGEDPVVFAAHLDFFTEEAPAWATRTLGLECRNMTAFGFSSGASLVMAAALSRSPTFASVVAFAVAMSPEFLCRHLNKPQDPTQWWSGPPPRFYLATSLDDAVFISVPWQRALARAGVSVHYVEPTGGHDLEVWSEELPAALEWCFQSADRRRLQRPSAEPTLLALAEVSRMLGAGEDEIRSLLRRRVVPPYLLPLTDPGVFVRATDIPALAQALTPPREEAAAGRS